MAIENLTQENFEKVIAKGIALIDFYATWCGPCRMLTPILEDIAEEYSDKITIGKVDIDNEQKIASDHQVTSVPTLILFKNGQEVNRLIGLRDHDSIKSFIDAAAE